MCASWLSSSLAFGGCVCLLPHHSLLSLLHPPSFLWSPPWPNKTTEYDWMDPASHSNSTTNLLRRTSRMSGGQLPGSVVSVFWFVLFMVNQHLWATDGFFSVGSASVAKVIEKSALGSCSFRTRWVPCVGLKYGSAVVLTQLGQNLCRSAWHGWSLDFSIDATNSVVTDERSCWSLLQLHDSLGAMCRTEVWVASRSNPPGAKVISIGTAPSISLCFVRCHEFRCHGWTKLLKLAAASGIVVCHVLDGSMGRQSF